ncbi:MAG: transcription termination/antitermination protein NusA, partial [Solobacterium sp.]|nr:transcription termination/antitermination protein NusA [Solobacterium sp.]
SAIPGERLVEGQKLRVVITEVNKETKGSQVLVSRADATLVKRLFEKEVPEIFQGIVEIKAIARDAGERTKMAVYSHNPEVDPIGACIGPRGSRVMGIIEELHGEKIDIFQWSDDITELVKNALAPAEVTAVLPSPEDNEKGLLVVVEPDQLSLAIGKRGKNARLAVKLTNHKIDIKTREEIEEKGYDYDELLVKAQERREEMRREAARREIERLEAEARAAEEKRLAAAAKLAAERAARGEEETEEEDLIPEEMQEIMRDRIRDEIAMKPEDAEESTEETPAVETSAVTETPTEETEPEEVEEAEEPQEEEKEETVSEKPAASKRHADLEEMAAKNTYVSVFEKLTETSKPKQSDRPKRKKKKSDEDEYKVRNKDLEEQIKKNLAAVDNRPIYSEEELAEIEAAQLEEEEREYDFDYDEYEDYYDEDNN